MKSIDGNLGSVAVDGGELFVFLSEEEVFKIHVPIPNFGADKNSDSEVRNDDGFTDKEGNEYLIEVISSMNGIDYILECNDVVNIDYLEYFFNNVKFEFKPFSHLETELFESPYDDDFMPNLTKKIDSVKIIGTFNLLASKKEYFYCKVELEHKEIHNTGLINFPQARSIDNFITVYSNLFKDIKKNEYRLELSYGHSKNNYSIEVIKTVDSEYSKYLLKNLKIGIYDEEGLRYDYTETKENKSFKDKKSTNPNWDMIELILVLDLYLNTFPYLPKNNSHEIAELSQFLIKYHKLLGTAITDNLRNQNSVFMKLKNFESLDKRNENLGFSNVSNRDKEVWEKYSNSKILIRKYTKYLKKIIEEKRAEECFLFINYNDENKRINVVDKALNINQMGKLISKSIFDKHTNAVLNIKSVSEVFSKYIVKYNAEHTSTIIGIFAKWGRGKTFFYNQLKKDIKKENPNIYFCKFQPWKYQKQESAWAYLYEKVLNNYLDNKKTPFIDKISSIREKFNKIFILCKVVNGLLDYIEAEKLFKIFLLNKTRLGIGKLVTGLTSILLLFIWIFMPWEWKFHTFSWVIGILGVTGTILLYKSYSFYMKSKGTVSDLITHYGKTKDYSNHLGFQNEIEKELKYLINTYITENDERLILFVDDLDRCNEKMIIDIMDALRLVLEDKDLNKKLTIITAVDERILLKSIKHKYFTKDDISETCEISPKEYIEKFFLVALKLNHLNDKDKEELVDEYTSVLNKSSSEFKSPTVTAIEKIQKEESLNEIEKAFVKEQDLREYTKDNKLIVKGNSVTVENKDQSKILHNDKVDRENTKDLKVLNTPEIDYIKKLILKYNIDTPRKINMMIQRYLLFKNFIFEELGYEGSNYELYISLIFYVLKKENLEELIEKCNNSKYDGKIKIDSDEFPIDRDRLIILVKYAEMVSPF